MLHIFNTLTGKKERLPRTKKTLNLFVCGPTVYDYAHLGHARTYLTFDLVVRSLRAQEYRIFYLQNITDIDDKIIERAEREHERPKQLAERFFKNYLEDMTALNIQSVNRYARATEYIAEIQDEIARLIETGAAYATNNGVYFEVKRFRNYGKLSRQNLDELRPGWRIEPDPQKKDPLDFALWKFSEHEPHWESPWGTGRPGWHIEDTAIAEKVFGSLHYDLHGGGVDLKFPHHECEIAEAESISPEKPFVKLWMHSGHLLVGGEKMSKSLNNFITIRDFLTKHSANTLRIMILSHHYRSPIDYTDALAVQAEHSLETIMHALSVLDFVHAHAAKNAKDKFSILKFLGRFGKAASPTSPLLKKYAKEFEAAMQDDFNTPAALAALFSLVSEAQKKLYSLGAEEAMEIKEYLQHTLETFGIGLGPSPIPKEISALVTEREESRKNQQFTHSDALRKKLEGLGYKVEDTPLGAFVHKSAKNIQ